MTKIIWIVALVMLGSFWLLNGHNPLLINKVVDNEQNPPIIIGYSNWSGWWPWAVAEHEGLFAKHGLQVELHWYDDYSQSLEDLSAGFLDGNCQTLNDTISFAVNSVKGEKIVLVNDNSAGNDKIIADGDIKKVEDLKNRTVAVEAGVVDDFLLSLALEEVGMSRNDVNILDAETGAAVEAYLAEQADAVGAFSPFWRAALDKEGSGEIVSSADFPGAIADLLVVTEELTEEYPDLVQGLVDTWFETLAFIEREKALSESIMAKRAQISVAELQILSFGTKMFDLQDNITAFEKQDDMSSLYFASQKIAKFLQEFGFFEHKPNVSHLLEPSFVQELKAFRTN